VIFFQGQQTFLSKGGENMKISCAIYTNEGIVLLSGIEDGKVLIPEELAIYPRIVTNCYGTRILLNEGSNNPEILEAIKEHIGTLLRYYENHGLVRIDTPSFYEMLIYNIDTETPVKPYPNVDELINSFLCSEGAEFIV
jgi:hypothetical protein